MPACELKPSDKKQYIGDVGQVLTHRYGKQKTYKPQQVRQASYDAGYDIDYVCWAYVIFCSAEDFTAIHAAAGEACDYALMKAEVLSDLNGGLPFAWPDIDLPWLEWPDIDLSGIFEWFNW